MSRKRGKRTPPSVRVVSSQEQRRQPNIKPGATNFTPVSDKVVNWMYQYMAPQTDPSYMYVPGAPIRPVPGITPPQGPRQYQYDVGYNIAQLPRSGETYSFADLRALASMYYGIQMCQQVWYDYINKLELVIEPRPDLMEEDMDGTLYQDDIQFYQEFFAYPDKDHDLHSWMQMAVRDQLEIDAVAIYIRKDRAGRPYALDLLDGATIKPLIDDRGRKPQPPFPAYEQFVYGVPACFLTSEDLIYFKETERVDSVYGMSRVEKIILNVNMALRKQTKDLARFTDGTVPQGVIQPAMDIQWSQEEIEAYEQQFNNLLAGNDEMRARIKILPRGFEYLKTDDPDIHIDFDTFILNTTASNYGITMAELAFTQDVNRSSGETQENVVYRRAMAPLMNRYAKMFTGILHKFFQDDRFIVKWKGFEEVEDFQAQASAYATLTNAGIISQSRAAHLMHLPVDVDLPSPLIPTKTGPVLLEDFANPKLREAQMQAQLSGLQLAAHPESAPSGEEKEPEEENQKQPEPPGKKPATQRTAENDIHQAIESLTRLLARTEDHLQHLRNNGVFPVPVPEEEQGVVLAFFLSTALAQGLALPGGERPEDLHLTLCYLGEKDDLNLDVPFLCQRLAWWAKNAQPVSGKMGGVGRFAAPAGQPSPVVALPDLPGLPAFRQSLVDFLSSCGIGIDETHGYTPHVTLAYLPQNEPSPVTSVPDVPLHFPVLSLAYGNERYYFPLGGENEPATTPPVSLPPEEERTPSLSTEFRRWRTCALNDLKAGRAIRAFASALIPPLEHQAIARELALCATADQVRAVFERARTKEREPSPKAVASVVGGSPEKNRSSWKLRW